MKLKDIEMKKKAFRFLTILFLFVVLLTFISYLVMLLWNWLVPELFSGPEISFLQAAGLLILSKILFTGIFHRKNHYLHRKLWRKEFANRLSQMDPEEREELRSRMKSKWGHWGCKFPEPEEED
jgi:uncharacterized membrane protein (DUF485 family)